MQYSNIVWLFRKKVPYVDLMMFTGKKLINSCVFSVKSCTFYR